MAESGKEKRKKNLAPPFKKGQSGNPAGRPKGSKNASTYMKMYLEAMTEATDPILKEKRKMPVLEMLTIAMINQARKGNVYAFNSIIDRVEGKVAQRHKHGGDEEGVPIPVKNDIDYSKLPNEVLEAIVAARVKDES